MYIIYLHILIYHIFTYSDMSYIYITEFVCVAYRSPARLRLEEQVQQGKISCDNLNKEDYIMSDSWSF